MKEPAEIHLQNLELRARVGVTAAEAAMPQRLLVSIRLPAPQSFELLDDHLANTIDYAAVRESVLETAAAQPHRLIETLAAAIGGALLERFPISEVTVEVRKFIFADAEFVAVKSTFTR